MNEDDLEGRAKIVRPRDTELTILGTYLQSDPSVFHELPASKKTTPRMTTLPTGARIPCKADGVPLRTPQQD